MDRGAVTNRKRQAPGDERGRSDAARLFDDLKFEVLLHLGDEPGEDDKGYLLRLSLLMSRWAAAGALATSGGEQGAFARQSVEWVATFGRVAKATLPGEIRDLERKIDAKGAVAGKIRALRGGVA